MGRGVNYSLNVPHTTSTIVQPTGSAQNRPSLISKYPARNQVPNQSVTNVSSNRMVNPTYGQVQRTPGAGTQNQWRSPNPNDVQTRPLPYPVI